MQVTLTSHRRVIKNIIPSYNTYASLLHCYVPMSLRIDHWQTARSCNINNVQVTTLCRLMSICVDTVVDVGHVPCNTSLSVDSTAPVVYVSGSVELDQSSVTPSHESTQLQQSPATVGCSLVARAKPRQTLNLTVFSFGGTWATGITGGASQVHHRDSDIATEPVLGASHGRAHSVITGNGLAHVSAPTTVTASGAGCSAQLLIVDGRRRHVSPLCSFRQQRERNVYQSHDNQVGLYFQLNNRKQSTSWSPSAGITRWTFLLKIEGRSDLSICLCVYMCLCLWTIVSIIHITSPVRSASYKNIAIGVAWLKVGGLRIKGTWVICSGV